MEVFGFVIVITLCLIGIVLKFLASGGKENTQVQDPSIKIDFVFFNNEGLKCKDGQIINCNIIVRGHSTEKISREKLNKDYLRALQKCALKKDPDWFFSSRDQAKDLFQTEFSKVCRSMTVDLLDVARLSYADECFTDNELQEKERQEYKAKVELEAKKRMTELDKEREEQEARLEAEKQAAIEKAEEEMRQAQAKVEAEMQAALEENERLLQEALEREKEAKRKLNGKG